MAKVSCLGLAMGTMQDYVYMQHGSSISLTMELGPGYNTYGLLTMPGLTPGIPACGF